jgi:hypothetical protein
MYSDIDSLVALSDSSYNTDLAASSDSDFDSEYDLDVDIVDEEEEDIPAFSYNVDDPCIEVGVVFPDVKQCKEVVTQHAIIHNHAEGPENATRGGMNGSQSKFFERIWSISRNRPDVPLL